MNVNFVRLMTLWAPHWRRRRASPSMHHDILAVSDFLPAGRLRLLEYLGRHPIPWRYRRRRLTGIVANGQDAALFIRRVCQPLRNPPDIAGLVFDAALAVAIRHIRDIHDFSHRVIKRAFHRDVRVFDIKIEC